MEKFVMFQGDAFIIETNGEVIERWGQVEIEGIITHIIYGPNTIRKIGGEHMFPKECVYSPFNGVEYIFTEFIKTISFKPY